MCFSATASFVSAGALLSVGVATAVVNRSESQKMFVLIPILFGLQQASEGVVWLTMRHADRLLILHLAILAFLFFAIVLWPVWVPWSILQLETNQLRRKYLFGLGYMGLAASAYAVWLLMTGAPEAEVLGHCVVYSYPGWKPIFNPNLYVLGYIIPTVAPLFLSSLRLAKITGWLVSIGLAVTFIMRREALTSVWCFSASIISFFIAVDVIAVRWPRQKPAARPFEIALKT